MTYDFFFLWLALKYYTSFFRDIEASNEMTFERCKTLSAVSSFIRSTMFLSLSFSRTRVLNITATHIADCQLADWTARGLVKSRTRQLAYWTSRGLGNSRMPPATLRAYFSFFWPFIETASCPVTGESRPACGINNLCLLTRRVFVEQMRSEPWVIEWQSDGW